MSLILGISAYYHDSAAALIKDGVIAAAAQEERFTRKKHDERFPANAVEFVLRRAGCRLEDLSAVAFYDKPLVKFERLLETYHAFAPKGLLSFAAAMPVWLREKLFLRSELERQLAKFKGDAGSALPELLFPEHHLSHAASAFYPSPFEEAAVLTIDGVGEWATTTICKGSGKDITVLREIHFPHSIGLLYSAFTAYCGFKVNSGEYKLMGLAPYGNAGGERTAEYERKILDELIDIRSDGSYLLNMDYFNYATGLSMYNEPLWNKLFSLAPRTMDDEVIAPEYMDMALAIQRVTESLVLKLAATAIELAGCGNLCLAGGVALNCVANGKLLDLACVENLWVQPASGDSGGALGAALSVHYIHRQAERTAGSGTDSMQGTYLGPEFSEAEVMLTCEKAKAVYHRFDNFDALCDTVAEELVNGNVVGWFQGRMEYGPRALGNRSILGDPRNPEMQKKMNLKIKYREGFRPFAPSVLEEQVAEVFDLSVPSPYMLLVAPVKAEHCATLPEDYQSRDMWERLYIPRSHIPAITHVDLSARIQSVSTKTNPRYHALISAFAEKTGVPLVVNTSFNVRGEPIVCTPEDAYNCFLHTEMDILVMGDVLLRKEEQAAPVDIGQWREQFEAD